MKVAALLLLIMLPLSSLAASQPAAPYWELTDLGGKLRRLDEWKGRWVLLKFGRTECPNCEAQWVEFGKAAGDLQKAGITILEIYVGDEKRSVQEHIAKAKFPLNPVVLLDPEGELVRPYRFSIVPYLVLVSPASRIAWRAGFTQAAELARVLASLVPGPG